MFDKIEASPGATIEMGKMVRQPKLMKVSSGMERRRSSYMSGSRGFVAK